MVIYIQGRMNSLVGPNVKSAVLIHFENIASNTIFEYDCILLTGLVLETSFWHFKAEPHAEVNVQNRSHLDKILTISVVIIVKNINPWVPVVPCWLSVLPAMERFSFLHVTVLKWLTDDLPEGGAGDDGPSTGKPKNTHQRSGWVRGHQKDGGGYVKEMPKYITGKDVVLPLLSNSVLGTVCDEGSHTDYPTNCENSWWLWQFFIICYPAE